MLKSTKVKLKIMFLVVILFSTICNIIKATFSGSIQLEPTFIKAKPNDEFAIEIRLVCDYVDGEDTTIGMKINYDKNILEYKGSEPLVTEVLDTRFEKDGLIFSSSPIFTWVYLFSVRQSFSRVFNISLLKLFWLLGYFCLLFKLKM